MNLTQRKRGYTKIFSPSHGLIIFLKIQPLIRIISYGEDSTFKGASIDSLKMGGLQGAFCDRTIK